MNKDARSVTTKVLSMLAAFTPSSTSLSLTELAQRASVSLPTAHRRAAELVGWGALERGGDGRYRVGLRLYEVAALAPRGLGLREAAMPFLEDLYELTHENVQLAVRDGVNLVFVERIAGRDAVPVHTRVGGRFTLHATGVGLALLAHAPVEAQQRVLCAPLPAYTPKTITDPERLRSVLATVRKQGFAVSDGQVTLDAVSVAAPIRNAEGAVVAAVSLVVRAGDAQPRTLAPLVRSAARGISREVSRARLAGGTRGHVQCGVGSMPSVEGIPMSEDDTLATIDRLVDEERELRSRATGTGLSDNDRLRLRELQQRLDQCWDLLRRRRANAEFGTDPGQEHERPVSEVESYQQ